jgi:hypothetical protein
MSLKNYVITQDFKSPYVVSTQHPKNPTKIMFAQFKKGQIIKGELKHSQGVPSFILYKDLVVVPLDFVKAVVTKDVFFDNADGDKKPLLELRKTSNPKVKYLDGAVVGAIIGFIGVYYAEKKGWLSPSEESPMQNKLIGMGVGALAGAYAIFRFRRPKSTVSNITKE